MKLLFVVFFIAVTMSFLAENIVVKTFTRDILAKRVSGYFLDKVPHEGDMDTLERLDNSIRNSKYTEKITAKFIQNIVENVLYDKGKELDISEEMEGLMQENAPEGMAAGQVEEIKKYVTEHITVTGTALEGMFFYSFIDGYYFLILKLYHLLTNIYFRMAMLLLFAADIIGLVILEKQEALKTIQIGSFVTAIFTAIIFFVIKGLSLFIRQPFSGGWINEIYLNMMVVFIIIELLISLGVFTVRKTLAYIMEPDSENICK